MQDLIGLGLGLDLVVSVSGIVGDLVSGLVGGVSGIGGIGGL
ncbi:hypothetical protein ACQEVY_30370 [Streptomyces sp. CA-288835]